MSVLGRVVFSFVLIFWGSWAIAGSFYRCDDGSGTAIYQSVACGANLRTVARHEFIDAPPAQSAKPERASRQRPAKTSRSSSRGLGSRGSEPVVAYACRIGSEQWVQARPCSPVRIEGADRSADRVSKPSQRNLTQSDVCRLVREGRYRGAFGERPADSGYRRNLLREGGC